MMKGKVEKLEVLFVVEGKSLLNSIEIQILIF